MKTHPSRYLLLGLVLSLSASFPVSIKAAGEEWKPVDPAHLSLKTSTVEQDADAEALFWEVRIDDNPEGDLIFNHYIRVKVFTERGRESQSKIDLEYGKIFGATTIAAVDYEVVRKFFESIRAAENAPVVLARK